MSGTPSNRVDTVLEALANSRRRRALQCLHSHEELTLPDLAEEVAVREADTPLPDLDAERVSKIYFSLYHTHVPKLVAADLVRYNQDRDLIRRSDQMDGRLQGVHDELGSLLTE